MNATAEKNFEDFSDETETSQNADAATLGGAQGVMLDGKKKYAVGLVWLAADEENADKLAKERGAKFKADFYCTRMTISSQHGFGFVSKGHKMGMPAAATIAADLFVGEWHGVFTADNGWWYLAVIGDMITPDGDQFFTSEQDAYAHFMAATATHNWPRFYAPASWNLPKSQGDIPFSRIVADGNLGAPLNPLNLDAVFSGKANKFVALIAIAGVLLLGIAGLVLTSIFSDSSTNTSVSTPESNDQTPLELPPALPVAVNANLLANFARPSMPDPNLYMQYCINGMDSLTLPLPGWTIQAISCDTGAVSVKYARGKYGSVSILHSYIKRFPNGVTSSYNGSDTFIISQGLTKPKDTETKRDLYTKNDAIVAISNRFQKVGMVTMTEFIPKLAGRIYQEADLNPEDLKKLQSDPQYVPIETITRDDFPSIKFEVKTNLPPQMASVLFDMPGVTIKSASVILEAGKMSWTYEAKLIPQPDKRIVDRYVKIQIAADEAKAKGK